MQSKLKNQLAQVALLCCSLAACQSGENASKAVFGRVYEVSLFDYSVVGPHSNNPISTYLIIETHNNSNETITLCNSKLANKRQCGNEYDISFHKRTYNKRSQRYAYIYECCLRTVVIPPKSSQKDTVAIGTIPATNDTQLRMISRYATHTNMVLYTPHSGQLPYYQDTIFYPFDENTKYAWREGWTHPDSEIRW